MRNRTLWLASALVAALVLAGPAGAQPPGGFPGGRGLTADDTVERLLSFDKNKDGKVTKDELPERMQDLIAKGDTNKDGALDKDEIKKLSTTLARDGGQGGGFGPAGRGGPPFGGGGPGGGFGAVLDELKLSEQKKEKAEVVLRVLPENVRKLQDLARAEMLLKMQEILSAEEFKKFKAASNGAQGGPFGGGRFGGGGPPFHFGPGSGIEADLDELKLTEKKKGQAEVVARAYEENRGKMFELARADLLVKMQEILSEEELKKFRAALPVFRGGPGGGFGGPPPGRGGRAANPAPSGPSSPGDLEKKLDQLQKDLDSLRREIRG